MILLFLTTSTTTNIRVPKCVAGEELNNRTVYLVHPYEDGKWPHTELEIFNKIIKTYQDFKIHLVLIHEEATTKNLHCDKNISRETKMTQNLNTTTRLFISTEHQAHSRTKGKYGRRKRRKTNDYHFNFNWEAKKLLDIMLNANLPESTEKYKTTQITIKNNSNVTEESFSTKINETTSEKAMNNTLDYLLKLHPNITVENTTYNQFFFNSPLYPYWPDMEEKFRIFAIRILQLWQNGGISFDLLPQPSPVTFNNTATKKSVTHTDSKMNFIYNTKVMKFIITEKKRFESLPDNVVAADDEGLHMESKIPCHAFFGEILMNLKKARHYSSIRDIIKSSVTIFCKHYAAKKKYCDNLQVKD